MTTVTEISIVGDRVGDIYHFVVDVGDGRDISREDRRRWIVAVNFRDVDLWIAVAVLLGRVRRLD